MSDDDYERVTADVRYGFWGPASHPSHVMHKVVPDDAVVIERGDLPSVLADWERDLLAGPGAVSGPRRTYDEIWREVLSLVAEAEYVRTHPPVDEAQVAAMDADLDQIIGDVGHNSPELAARLIAQGWTKPVTP